MVRRDLADCQALHRTVLSAFPATSSGGGAREEFGLLYRLEPTRRVLSPTLLVQCTISPDWGQLPPDYLAPMTGSSNPAMTSLEPFLDSLQAGELLRFRLRANPTRKIETKSGPNGERRNGRRVKLKTEAEQITWLRRKAADGSFDVLGVRASPEVAALDVVDEGQLTGWHPRTGQPSRMTFGAVLFDGHLRVLDPDAFRQTVRGGLGSGKAYGFGLLSVART